MGGRGGGSGFNSGAIARELTAQDGTKLDLSEFPLQYGSPETLSYKERAAVDAFEQKRYKNKIEYGTLITVDGLTLIEKKGGSGSVKMPSYLYAKASVMSHNHPRSGKEVGELGGTFSGQDLVTFGSTNISTMRATALEGTYSITKGPSFDRGGLNSYYRQVSSDLDKVYRANMKPAIDAYKSVESRYYAKQATYEEVQTAYKAYLQKAHYEFNRELVAQHNALIAGQKQYGYTYTLERRQ